MENRSLHTLSSINSIKDKNQDTFEFRKDFIKNLLEGNKLNSLIDFDNDASENFIHGNGNGNNKLNDKVDNNTDKKNDTRIVLNKKIHSFYKVINQIGGKLIYVKSGTSGHTCLMENKTVVMYISYHRTII